MFDYLQEQGYSAQAVLACAGLLTTPLLPTGRVPLSIYERLFAAGEQLTGDHCFGLNMGASPRPRSWGLVSHLAISAPDAMTAVSALMDYSELQLNFARFRLRLADRERMCMVLQHDAVASLSRQVVEHLLANIAVVASREIGYALPELRVQLAHNDAVSAAHFAQLIGAEVSINAKEYIFEASPDFLQQRALYGEEDLYRVTEALARERLMKLRGEDPVLNRVREVVLRQLPAGLPKIDTVASDMGMSARTLQRRLQQRNLRYQRVLDEVRCEVALQLIDDHSLSLNEIAAYLAFNDQSALQHAFRRWQGTTPGQFRRRFSHHAGIQ